MNENTKPASEFSDNDMSDALVALSEAIVDTAPEVLRYAHNEADATTEVDEEAAHFIKVNGERLGRDIELYGFMARVAGSQMALANFLGEVVMPLKELAPRAYALACEKLIDLGKKVYPVEMQKSWEEMLT